MPTNRFNYSDDFVLNNGKVGINSASPQEKLDVVGVTRAENLSVVGVSSLTGYEGFLRANHNVAESTSLEGGQGTTGSLSGEIVIGTGVTVTGVTTATSGQGYIDTLKVYNTFTVPVGLTTDRPTAPKPGQLYYNRDFATIEFYDGNVWRQVDNVRTGGRGVFGGGQTPTRTAVIDYINIASTGNAVNFGNLTVSRSGLTACSSPTRGLFGGGIDPGVNVNTIDYITIASEGNAIDFGDLLNAVRHPAGLSSTVRGVFGGGYSNTNVIQYVQINTLGNALDFGDLIEAVHGPGACASSTRGVFASGNNPNIVKTIQYITISSTGNAVSFGDLTQARGYASGSSNSTRGIFANGFVPGTFSNTIDYITIASTGNAVDFGDTGRNSYGAQGCATNTRSIVAVGELQSPASTILNVIEYVQINTTSNSFDFGDLSITRNILGACSDSHGGLGGF